MTIIIVAANSVIPTARPLRFSAMVGSLSRVRSARCAGAPRSSINQGKCPESDHCRNRRSKPEGHPRRPSRVVRGAQHQEELAAAGLDARRDPQVRREPREAVLEPRRGLVPVGPRRAATDDLTAALARQPLDGRHDRRGLDDEQRRRPRHHRLDRALAGVAGPVRQPLGARRPASCPWASLPRRCSGRGRRSRTRPGRRARRTASIASRRAARPRRGCSWPEATGSPYATAAGTWWTGRSERKAGRRERAARGVPDPRHAPGAAERRRRSRCCPRCSCATASCSGRSSWSPSIEIVLVRRARSSFDGVVPGRAPARGDPALRARPRAGRLGHRVRGAAHHGRDRRSTR